MYADPLLCKFLFSYAKLILKIVYFIVYNIPCFSPKQNTVLSEMLLQRKASKYPEEGLPSNSLKNTLWESYDAHLKRARKILVLRIFIKMDNVRNFTQDIVHAENFLSV